MSMDGSFSGDLVRHRRSEIPPFSYGSGPIGPHLNHHIRLYTLTFTFGGKGGDEKLPSSYGGDLLDPPSEVIRIVFSLLMSPSLVR